MNTISSVLFAGVATALISTPGFAQVAVKGEHYQCYDVVSGPSVPTNVQIKVFDQFGDGRLQLGRPVMHCNPSGKVHDDREFDIINKELHLVCYQILEQTDAKVHGVYTGNQISEQKYKTSEKRRMFCVPSIKEHL